MLAITLIIHKIPLAFTVGTTFEAKRPKMDKYSIFFYILFVLMTPIGIIMGMAIGASSASMLLIII